MSDLRKIDKGRNRGIGEKNKEFSHDLKKKEHLKPKVFSLNESPFNPNVTDRDQPPFNPNVMKSEIKPPFNPNSDLSNGVNNNFEIKVEPDGAEENNTIIIKINLDDIKKKDSNSFTDTFNIGSNSDGIGGGGEEVGGGEDGITDS